MSRDYQVEDLREKLHSAFPELKPFSASVAKKGMAFHIVGGALRDLLLGVEPKDIDFVPDSSTSAGDMARLFIKHIGGVLIEFHSHGDVYRVVHAGRSYDFTELQGEDLEADLHRRDFTINSMSLSMENLSVDSGPPVIIDPMGGLKDIEGKLIKINNDKVFDDDPLRILRLFRFAYKFNFRIDDFSYRLIPQKLFGLDRISSERIRDELFELLRFEGTAKALGAMEGVGLISRLFPVMGTVKGFPQNDFHHLDVFSHSLEAIAQLENPELLQDTRLAKFEEKVLERIRTAFPSGHCLMSLMKLALLLHDIGKPGCASYDDNGRLHFIGHEKLSVSIAKEYLADLRVSKRETNYILQLIEGHMRPGQINIDSHNLHKQLYRYFKDFGPKGVDLALFSLADRLAARGTAVTEEMVDGEYEICARVFDTFFNKAQVIAKPPKLVSGKRLMKDLGVEPGPRVGLLLDRIEEAQIDGTVTDADGAMAYAKELISLFESEK